MSKPKKYGVMYSEPETALCYGSGFEQEGVAKFYGSREEREASAKALIAALYPPERANGEVEALLAQALDALNCVELLVEAVHDMANDVTPLKDYNKSQITRDNCETKIKFAIAALTPKAPK